MITLRSLTLTSGALIVASVFVVGCGDGEDARALDGVVLDRSAWLGSADGWGLLGLPLSGGALTFRRAIDLESPTWAPPEMPAVRHARPGRDAVWVAFADSGLAYYEYRTGHFRTFEDDLPIGTDVVSALSGRRALLVDPDSTRLRVLGGEPWTVELGGRLERTLDGRDERALAVIRGESGVSLSVLEPPAGEPAATRSVGELRDVAVTAWGGAVYYLPEDGSTLMGLSLPELEDLEPIELPEPATAVAATPSAHRLYAAAGTRLYAFDRASGREVRRTELPGRAMDLRFGATGADLLVRLEGEDLIAVVQVGVDTVVGVIAAEWSDDLPQALPGGRLVARSLDQLLLYELPSLTELTRVDEDDARLWLAVEWEPPRPREDLAGRRTLTAPVAAPAGAPDAPDEVEPLEVVDEVAPGFYAVVLAARSETGVDELVARLRSVGYPGVLDRHRDATGVEWFRAMIGPYDDRTRAETAARELSARYAYKPWILTVEGDEAADSLARPGGEL